MDGPDYLKNYGVIFPATAIHQFNGCTIIGATGQEYEEFKKWFESERYQQAQLNEMKIDMWIRYNDMVIDHIGYSMQDLFYRWKKSPPSKEPFGFTTHTFKK